MVELQHSTDDRDKLKEQLAEKDKELHAARQSTTKHDYQNKMKAANHTIESLKLQVQRLGKARDHAEKQSSSLQEALEARDRAIRQLQAEKLQSLESALWAPLSSSEIKHEINSVLSSIRQWSTDHSAIPPEVFAESRNIEGIDRRLTALGCISEEVELMETIRANKKL